MKICCLQYVKDKVEQFEYVSFRIKIQQAVSLIIVAQITKNKSQAQSQSALEINMT